MSDVREIILTKITMGRRCVQLEYICDLCYENPRTKRKHKTHYHGGGDVKSKSFHEIDWNKRRSFGTRIPHCSCIYVEPPPRDRFSEFSFATTELIRNLPEIELIYEPEITEIPFSR
jgi:hypothetical protein